MARLISVALGAVVILASGNPAVAQLRGSSGARLPMARAMCTTGPCAPMFNFQTGRAQFKRLRQPNVLARRDIGIVRLDRLWTSGPPLPTELDGLLRARVAYANVDPDGNCPEIGSVVTQTIATSSMRCQQAGPTRSNCRGRLVLNPTVISNPNCTDVHVAISEMTIEVFEAGGVGDDTKLIARNGALVTGKTPDCNSGGAGCP